MSKVKKKCLEFFVAPQKGRICFSSSVFHMLSLVRPMQETQCANIAEIFHDELSHNIFSLIHSSFFQIPQSCLLVLLLEVYIEHESNSEVYSFHHFFHSV